MEGLYDAAIALRNRMIGFLYRHVAKPLFFLRDPEDIHDGVIRLGRLLGSNPVTRRLMVLCFGYGHPMLAQELRGIRFPNPVGLAAGFDKNGQLPAILPSVGFGFAEIGSVTGEPCAGNPRPRLWRLVKSKALVVYYGLKNDGAEAVAARVRRNRSAIPLGMSEAKTNSPATCETNAGVKDYVKAYTACRDAGSFDVVNISCPNAFGGEPFTDPGRLEQLLSAIDRVRTPRPLFVKISPDLSHAEVDALLAVIGRHRVDGIVCANLTKRRGNPKIVDSAVPEKGGISGKAQEDLANDLIGYLRRKTRGKYLIIGCGGIFSAEDAYKKIKLGASLVELVTGMIFEGPQTISEINRGLVRLLKRDGFASIEEAVGSGHGTSAGH